MILRALRPALLSLGLVWVTALYIRDAHGLDALQWYTADLDSLYAGSSDTGWSYVYSPAFAQAVQPFQALPWPVFLSGVIGIGVLCCAYLIGPWVTLLLLIGQVPVLDLEFRNANLNLVAAVAIWAGFRYPAAWAFVLLTKVTPGVGLLWFAVRREWRSLLIALGATSVIVLASYALAPQLWTEWALFLSAGAPDTRIVDWPLRLAAAVGLVVWGARTDRPWVVPLAAVLAHTSLAWPLAAGAVAHFLGRPIPMPVRDRPPRRYCCFPLSLPRRSAIRRCSGSSTRRWCW